MKHAEDLLMVFGGDADAVVLNPEADVFASFLGVNANFRRHARPGEFERIRQQVLD